MNASFRESLQPDLAEKINEICDRFESVWKSGERPRIEDFAGNTPESERAALVRELLLVELAYRKRLGETPLLTEYAQWFTDTSDSIHAIFRAAGLGEPETVKEGALAKDEASTPNFQEPPTRDSRWPAIAGYEILGVLGRGGMGVVYSGHDLTLDRNVAVKTLVPGADPIRFVTESKITARLPHPGIPPVHALAELADGMPFLVMKLIEGRTLADLLKERPSPLKALSHWVQVFEQIAQAVGFAHAQGIVHRDLKPSNVMVGSFGEVQVMDWGLAKDLRSGDPERIEKSLTDKAALQTLAGAIMGTPSYMAPEQARGEPLDARADVFALGGILTFVLTGSPAFVGTDIDDVVGKAARGDLADTYRSLDACGADAELIAIAKRCLVVNRDDRLADARIVAEQVAAYRAGVETRLRKAETDRAAVLVRDVEHRKRRQVLLVSGTILTVVLVAGVVGTTIGMMSASNEAAEKDKAREREKLRADGESAAKTEAQLQRQKAETRLVEATRRLDLLLGVVADIDYRKVRDDGKEMTDELSGRLIEAARQLEAEPPTDALKLAEMQDRLGRTLISLGYAREAIPLFQKARDVRAALDHSDTLSSAHNLASAYGETGRLREAKQLFEEILERKKAKFGMDHAETLVSMNGLASACLSIGLTEKAIALFSEILERRKGLLPSDHLDVLGAMNNLGAAYLEDGQVTKAIQLHKEAHARMVAKLMPDHPDALVTASTLASAYLADGQFETAIGLATETLAKRKTKLGSDHPATLTNMNNLAMAFTDSGHPEKAIPLLHEALEKGKAKRGIGHSETLKALGNLGNAYAKFGQLPKALLILEEAHARMQAKLGPLHPDTLSAMSNLVEAYRLNDQMDKAMPLAEAAIENMTAKFGPDHPQTFTSMTHLATIYADARDLKKAWPLFEAAAAGTKAHLSLNHPTTLNLLGMQAEAYRKHGRAAEAVALLEEALKRRTSKFGPDHRDTLKTLNNLADACAKIGQTKRSVALFEECLERRKQKLPVDDPEVLMAMSNLACAYLDDGQSANAIPLSEETLQKRTATLGANHPSTLVSMNNLAQAYHQTGQTKKALPLFESALEKMRANPDPGPAFIQTLRGLAYAYRDSKQLQKAQPLLEELLPKMKVDPGADHLDTLVAMHELALIYGANGKRKEGLDLLHSTLERMQATLAEDNASRLTCMDSLAVAHVQSGNADKALPLLQLTLQKRTKLLGPADPKTLSTMRNLAVTYQHLGEFSKALLVFDELLEKKTAINGRDDANTREILDEWSDAYANFFVQEMRMEKKEKVEKSLKRGIATLQRTFPDSWQVFNLRSWLGAALVEQKKYADAEPLLLDAYHGLKAREDSIPMARRGCLFGSAGRLVKLYQLTNRPADAEKWTKIAAEFRQQGAKLIAKVHPLEKTLRLIDKLDAAQKAIVFQFRLKGDVTYVFDMISPDGKALDPYLYLRDEKGKLIAEDDDSGGNLNARIVVRAPADGVYQLQATSFNVGNGGFVIIARPEKNVDGKQIDKVHDVNKELKLADKLDSENDAVVFQIRLKAGVNYTIDMVSPEPRALDPFLFLHDAKGTTLAQDDDSGGDLNARIRYTAKADSIYRIRATSFNAGRGDFTLTIRPDKSTPKP